MAFILATDFDSIAYMSKMAFFFFFFFEAFFTQMAFLEYDFNGFFLLLFCMIYCIIVKKPIDTSKKKKNVEHSSIQSVLCGHRSFLT